MAIELAVNYFEKLGMKVNSTKVIGVSVYGDELIKEIKVQINGESWFRYVGITEDEKVVELPII